MSAYLIVEIKNIRDQEMYADYRKKAPATLKAYGAKYRARGSRIDVLEGEWKPDRVVIVEFPSAERAREWYASEAYQPIKKLRVDSVDSDIVLLDGLTPEEDREFNGT